MITIQLSLEEAELLRSQVKRQAEHIESELVHTDAPAMQHELARDLERVHELLGALERQIAAEAGGSSRAHTGARPSA
jgi:hypothetical protein